VIKVYFDASVIIAAMFSSGGGSAKLIQFVRAGVVAGITSQTIIDEVESNSAKINKNPRQIRQFIKNNLLLVRERIVLSETRAYENIVDEGDAHVVAGAKSTKCDYLVTLDKRHLLQEGVKRKVKPVRIVTPKELLAKIIK